MTVTLKPLGDRVVVKPKAKDEMTSSGIVLPDTARKTSGGIGPVGRAWPRARQRQTPRHGRPGRRLSAVRQVRGH
jgi:co-chaperonin GroES (HSP10)